MTGRPADGMALMRESIARLNQIGANMDRPYLLALLAEMCAANGHAPEASGLVADALDQVRGSRTYFYEAELYRLRGVLLLQAGGRSAEHEAEANLRQALGIAKRQKARALELRAATSLCRLLHARGMPDEGLKVLAPVYRWFKEGRTTADLAEAGELVARKVTTSQSSQ
jgi:predicted ATPase